MRREPRIVASKATAGAMGWTNEKWHERLSAPLFVKSGYYGVTTGVILIEPPLSPLNCVPQATHL